MTRGRFARVDADTVLDRIDSLLDEADSFRERLREAFEHAETEGRRYVSRVDKIRSRFRGPRG
jgi:hypothetical protein